MISQRLGCIDKYLDRNLFFFLALRYATSVLSARYLSARYLRKSKSSVCCYVGSLVAYVGTRSYLIFLGVMVRALRESLSYM